MTRAFRLAFGAVVSLCAALAVVPPGGAVAEEPKPKAADPAFHGSAVAALLDANGGKPPATGEELWKALGKLGKFAQLPVMFSAVHLDSGIASPRVVITPAVTGLSGAGVTEPNLNARLFLAANMERSLKGGDPRVTMVEFISWNSLRRRFDFGVIENMGGGQPQLKIVDGGRCFSCHKNRGPILGAPPWSNTSHDDILRLATAAGLQVDGSSLPDNGPFALPRPAGKPLRDRIDGMALATPEAAEVDLGVRLGAALRVNRDTFRLMTRSPDGRKALVGLLAAVVAPGPLDPNDKSAKVALDNTLERSFVRFAAEWLDLQKEAKPSVLLDADPAVLLLASGVRPLAPAKRLTGAPPRPQVVRVPGLRGGGGSRWAAPPRSARNAPVPSQPASQPQPPPVLSPGVLLAAAAARKAAADNQAAEDLAATLVELVRYESARSVGFHGLISQAQPSNPQAFLKPAVKVPPRPSSIVGTVMLANTIGLTEGDRKFLADALADAAKRANQPKVTAATLARAVFEGPEFADVLAGGPLPDRDEFKDRFVAGLHHTLMKDHPATKGFTPERREYASGPKYDRKLAEEVELAVVPTTACLRCHDVRPAGKPRMFEPIPALAFDPLDKRSREAWVAGTNWERRRAVLARMAERLYKDADMPPQDSPEHDHFRVKDAAAFADARTFLEAELEKVKKP